MSYAALALLCCLLWRASSAEQQESSHLPSVFVCVLARNCEHTLPNFLGYLEQLDYPKDRISVWIRTDHNEDNTSAILSEWTRNVAGDYAAVSFEESKEWLYPTSDPFSMPDERYLRLTQLRQQALEEARNSSSDYLLMLDTDNFLVNNRTLSLLMEQQKPIIAPMLLTLNGSAYSNFWCGQNEQGYYERTPDYIPILMREKEGCFQVPVVHSTVLVDLRKGVGPGEGLVDQLAYWPPAEGFTGPVDDILHFAFSAKTLGLSVWVLNTEYFGQLLKPQAYGSLAEAADSFMYYKLHTLVDYPPVVVSKFISLPEPQKDNLGLDAVFMISLARRTERRSRMLACLKELNFNYTLFDAVDGKLLNQSYLDQLGIRYLPGWKDPWGERPMTFGEVGCFLSHYTIWQKMLSEGLQEVLVLEDDVNFQGNFRAELRKLLHEAHTLTPSWDLIYVGRKALNLEAESLVPNATVLAKPSYSYWTLSYLLSIRGARKLVDQAPFKSLLPVDEYLPIMFNTHPEADWVAHFTERNLEAYSAYPLLAEPTHYVGDEGWYSDTEPPKEVLDVIKERKRLELLSVDEKEREERARLEKLRESSVQRHISAMKAKLKLKSEL